MNLRVAISGKVKDGDVPSRSESESERGAIFYESEGADAKPSDLHMSRMKSR